MGRGGMIYSNGGYVGHSMSKRAALAYSNGEKPKSKWTKAAILEEIEWHLESETDNIADVMAEFRAFTKDYLFNELICKSSWHHVGAFAKAVDFYQLRECRLKWFIEEHSDRMPKSAAMLAGE